MESISPCAPEAAANMINNMLNGWTNALNKTLYHVNGLPVTIILYPYSSRSCST